MPNPIIYEQPLNERMRTLLRLEHLFSQTRQALDNNSAWHRQAIAGMIEVLSLLERADLKTEFFKEIDRLSGVLNKLKQKPDVNQKTLDNLLDMLKEHSTTLRQTAGRLGDGLRSNELLNIVRPRLAIPGGTCSFDVPAFHFWLSQPAKHRHDALETWYEQFFPIETTVTLLLNIIRHSAYEEEAVATAGYFQKMLETNTPCQMIRIKLNDHSVFPEISGGKHRVSVRFLTQGPELQPIAKQEDIAFTLGCCII